MAVLLLLVGTLALLHFLLVFRLNINWDEFRFLSDVYRLQAGTLTAPLQTLHVHGFRWLPGVGSNEIDQIIAARVVYFFLLLGSCGFVFLIARRFLSTAASLFVIVCYLSYSDILAHGTSFRFDGLAVFFILAALALLLRKAPTGGGTIAAGVLVAVAFLVTMKTIFYAPTFLAIMMLRAHPGSTPIDLEGRNTGSGRRETLADIALFALAFALSLVVLYFLHRSTLGGAGGETVQATSILQRAGPLFLGWELLPARHYLIITLILNLVIWGLLTVGVGERVATYRRLKKSGKANPEFLLLLALLLPLASLLVYRNGFPYYYAFIMPPALVFCGFHIEALVQKVRLRESRIYALLLGCWGVALLGSFSIHYLRNWPDDLQVQRQVIEAVHEIFPEPVPYIDRNSMISSFPKVGFFMSTAGFRLYHEVGEPIFEDLIVEVAPQFLLANHPALMLDRQLQGLLTPGTNQLLDDDLRILEDNFIPHWGPLWILGKSLNLTSTEPVEVKILVPGFYTLEADGPVSVGTRVVRPNERINLDRTHYEVRSTTPDAEIELRWSGHTIPLRAPPEGALFRGF